MGCFDSDIDGEDYRLRHAVAATRPIHSVRVCLHLSSATGILRVERLGAGSLPLVLFLLLTVWKNAKHYALGWLSL